MKKNKSFFTLIIITILLELFIFNFRFFVIKFSRLKKEQINTYEILREDKESVIKSQEIKIVINKKVQGVKLNFEDLSDKNINVNVSFKDEGEIYSRKDYTNIVYNQKLKNTEYFVYNSQGNCKELYLYITSTGDFHLENIEINTWYYHFNFLRVLIILLVGTFLLYYKEINIYFENRKKLRIAIYAILIITFIMIYGIFSIVKTENRRFSEGTIDVRVDPYNLLTESLLHGRIDLNYPYEGSPVTQQEINRLANLNNPRDISQRFHERILHYFDTAFCNGTYYCYYGIVPVLTVMLPIAMLTGIIVYSNIPCFIYCSILAIVVLLLYLEILKRLKVKLDFILEVFLYIILFVATGILILTCDSTFYQATELCGLAWCGIGIYLLLKLDNNKKVNLKLFLAGLSFGLMVCSRPVYVLYFIIYIILAYKHIVINKKINIDRFLSFAMPIIVIAILQMTYNYVRFGNVFEFGQFYQLTINDPAQQKMDIGMSISGIVAYLFNMPNIVDSYPYILPVDAQVKNGTIIYTEKIFGLICYPFLWVIVMGRSLLKKEKILKYLWVSMLVITIIALAVNTCLAGINQRYAVDVQPCIAFIALIIWLKYIKKGEKSKTGKKLLIFVGIITLIMNFGVMINRIKVAPSTIIEIENIMEDITYTIRNTIFFYK